MTKRKTGGQPVQTYIEKHGLKADWHHWCKATTWDLRETAYLIHGIEPSRVFASTVNHIAVGEHQRLNEFINAKRDFDLLQRAKNDGFLGEMNVPIRVLNHCIAFRIEVPLELKEICIDNCASQIEAVEKMQSLAEEINKEDEKQEATASDKPLGEKKEENLLRLIGKLKSIIKDKTGQSQKDLIAYIHAEEIDIEKDGLQNKGLSERTLKEIFSRANAILKSDEA